MDELRVKLRAGRERQSVRGELASTEQSAATCPPIRGSGRAQVSDGAVATQTVTQIKPRRHRALLWGRGSWMITLLAPAP